MQELSFVTTKTRLGQNIFDATKIVMSFTPFYTIIGQVWGNNSRFYCPRDKERVSHSKKEKKWPTERRDSFLSDPSVVHG